MEFRLIGRNLARELRLKKAEEFRPARMAELAESVRVEPVDERLFDEGLPVTARNFPAEGRVRVDTPRWAVMSGLERERLVGHELFGLMKLDDRKYERTEKMLHALGRVLWISFDSILIEGPAAVSLVEHMKWKGFVGVGYADQPGEEWVQMNLNSNFALFCQTPHADFIEWERANGVPPGQSAAGSFCILNMDGVIDKGSRAVIKISGERAEEVWEALGGTRTTGFCSPGLQGQLDQDGKRELHLEVGSLSLL
jgi:hypothetical protein